MPEPKRVAYRCPELADPHAMARAFEALRLRLDSLLAWPAERCWPSIACIVGYPSGDAAKHAASRTMTAVKYRQSAQVYGAFLLLAEAVGLPADARHVRQCLQELDGRSAPEDADPPKPKKKRKPDRATLARRIQREILRRRDAVDANAADPQAIIVRCMRGNA